MVADVSTLLLEPADHQGLHAERYVGDRSPEYEYTSLPGAFVRGVINERMIRPGMWMHWGGELVDRPVFTRVRPHGRFTHDLHLVFALEGAWSERHGSRGEFIRAGGTMSAIGGNTPTAWGVLPAPTSFHACVSLEPQALRELLDGDNGPAAAILRHVAAGNGSPELTVPLSPSARLALESIRRCPYVGAARAMAIEARCNDLVVEIFQALGRTRDTPPAARRLRDGVHAAAAMLDRDIAEPPSLADLARKVGLSETSLKRAFRQEFGTTAFGHLRRRRMERARALLDTGRATVVEASLMVGYCNPSHFAAAFRREFGVNPKSYQLGSPRAKLTAPGWNP